MKSSAIVGKACKRAAIFQHKSLFITGTDTGVGKSAVACALARIAANTGASIGVFKPVETGWTTDLASDAWALLEASGSKAPLDLVCPYRLKLPAAPSVAAREEGIEIEFKKLLESHARLCADHDLVIAEGAGGLMVPLNGQKCTADLIAALRSPVLVVARSALGTINHTLLTLEALERRSIKVMGVLLNQLSPHKGPEETYTAQELVDFGKSPVLANLPYSEDLKALDRYLIDKVRL